MLVDNINRKNDNSSTMAISNYIKDDVPAENTFKNKITDKATISDSNTICMTVSVYEDPSKADIKNKSDEIGFTNPDNAENRKNQMIVLSNTVSEEDYMKIEKDGFSVSDSDSSVILSESDKIKAALAKQGVDISKYGGISDKALESIAGSPELAIQMAAAFEKNDIPINDENLSDLSNAMEKVKRITDLSTSTAVYMVKNQLLPTIDNIYKAQFVGNECSNIVGMPEQEFSELATQIKDILHSSGLEDNEQNLYYAKVLIDNGINISADNIKYLDKLNALSEDLVNIESEDLYNSMVIAISEGKRPGDAILVEGFSLIEQSKNFYNIINDATDEDVKYIVANNMELTAKNLQQAAYSKEKCTDIYDDEKYVTAKRQLEETRLMMTVEANYALLKRGISIDTKPLESLVEELKNIENQYYKNLLDGNDVVSNEKNISVFASTIQILDKLKFQPAYALTLSSNQETVESVYSRSEVIKAEFDKANLRYETMMTSPRSDLGDNIHKAFRNVDDILTDLDIEITESNKRAVRILAYNESQISPENIMKMKAVDEQVQRTFKNMTPATTLEMIRQGISPLDLDIEQLNEIAVKIQNNNPENETEKFSKFLYKLEQNKGITEEEREAYIGIYRLIAQVEKTDGAVIGSLINQGADITMRNLLTAVRNGKKGQLDYKIDEEFAGVQSTTKGTKIDEQIETAYSINCLSDIKDSINLMPREMLNDKGWEQMTPEQLKEYINQIDDVALQQNELIEAEYAREMLEEFNEVKVSSQDVYKLLDRFDIKNSMANILAASRMLRNPNIALRKVWNDINIPEDATEMINQMKNQVLQQFGEAVKNPEEMADAQENLAEIATHAMDTMIIEGKQATSQDIKELRMISKELMLWTKKAKEESYLIPIETGEGVSGVSLKVIRGEKDKGLIDIFFRGELMGKIAASFEAKENGVAGTIAVNDEETKKLIEDNISTFVENINQTDMDIKVAIIPEISYERFEMSSLHKEQSYKDTDNSDYEVQTSRLYGIAEGFIKALSSIL